MLRYIVAVLTSLVIGVTVASADEKDRPIPQNPEQQQKRYRDILAWNRKSLGDAYEKVGKKDPRWDEQARKALEAAARYFSQVVDPSTQPEEVYSWAKRAVDAGCDDPLILYLYGRVAVGANFPGQEEYERRQAAAALALKSSNYSAYRRYVALDHYSYTQAYRAGDDAKARKEAFQLLDETLDLMIESRAKDDRTPETVSDCLDTARQVIWGYRALGEDYQAAFDRVDAKLAKAEGLKGFRQLLKGSCLISYAWEARGSGFVNTVTEDGARKFHERLADARKALEGAWDLDPSITKAATLMLTVELGSGGDRDVMEKWFERAMQGDSDNLAACEAKMDWLDPKWHGTPEDLLAFGQACRDTKNWRSGIPLLLANAHFRLSLHLAPADRQVYFHSSKTWRDIKEVYEEFLAHKTPNQRQRSEFALYCFLCGHYPESKKQFDLLGDSLVATSSYSLDAMKKIRALATEQMAPKPADTGLPPAPKGFTPLSLEWDDPSGETGVLTSLNECLSISDKLDVILFHKDIFLLKKGKTAVRVYHDDGRYVRLEPPCYDGRYVWVPVRSEDDPPFLVVIDPATDQTWTVAIGDGLPFKPQDEMPEDGAQFIQVAAIEPGRVCVSGSHLSSWVANVSFEPQKGKSVDILLQADEKSDNKDPDHWKRTSIRFRPTYMATLTEPQRDGGEGPRRLILVDRNGSSAINNHPLVVDPDAKSVTVLQRAIHVSPSSSILPGAFSVHEGRFYWVEGFGRANQGQTLMRLSLGELDGKPVIRRLGPVEKVVVHDGRIDLVGEQWAEADLKGGDARPLTIKLPWLSMRDFSTQLKAERLGAGDPTKPLIRFTGLCYSRQLGLLALCGTKTSTGIVYQVDLAEAKQGQAGSAPQ
ncbi:hypothetical protein V5E97_23435 [Singulisphaera sp. Ch08]|uniref:Uncharacterized protein n=1 Tax=Singulisphaera sp. Ch08 TaxID=3120278 RepID=A0AAU7C810_9BACT